MIDVLTFSTGAAVGADGAATATGYSNHVAGKVLSVAYTRVDSPPNTTDFTLSCDDDPTGMNLLQAANIAGNWRVFPRSDRVFTEGYVQMTYDGTRKLQAEIPVCGRLKGVIAQANAGDSITFTVWLES